MTYKHRAKLTDADKTLALTLFFRGESHKAIALKINCSESNVFALTRKFRAVIPRARNHPRLVNR